ncbi:MAG: ABC transporter ATP-binding protein [Bacteroidales bacterium]
MTDNNKGIILELKSLLVGYIQGKKLLPLFPEINTNVLRGELIAVIGRNGIGKSTLLKTLAGLITPLGGEILIAGKKHDEFRRKEFAIKTGYVSTEQVRVDSMKVSELVGLGRYPYTSWTGQLKEKDQNQIAFALKKTGLTSMESRFINELSDGEKQKAMIARVIAQDTDIMIMDEPTAFLDIRNKYEIINLLRILSDEKNKTIVFSTHDLSVAMNECDRIWILTDNSFYDGAPEDLILQGAMNKLFEDSGIVFNPENASYCFAKQLEGEVNVTGEESVKYWTEKAVNRAGFRTVSYHTGKVIMIASDEMGLYWVYKNGNTVSNKLRSLYEVIQNLKKNDQK